MEAHARAADNQGREGVELRGLVVEAPNGDVIVDGVSLCLASGEILGLVGESGSGKTTTAMSLLGYAQGGARITAGEIVVGGDVIRADDQRDMRRLRGSVVTYVPQNPGTALNPSMRIGDAVAEMLRQHGKGEDAEKVAAAALRSVGLPEDEAPPRRFPHQLSGGQQQRVCISIAVACEPSIVVLDEPTTGLDVVTQATILAELTRLRRVSGIAMVYVAHDLAVVAQISDRIAVMYGGRIVEEGLARQILRHPRHPYTRGLLTSIPDHVKPRALDPMPGVAVGVGDRPGGCCFAPRCELRIERCEERVPDLRAVNGEQQVRCVRAEDVADPDAQPLSLAASGVSSKAEVLTVSGLRAEHKWLGGSVVAARDVHFVIRHGECLALVGESGSGKTTIARTIAGLHPASAGDLKLHGEPLGANLRQRTAEQRRRIQMIFQNPSDALNPRHTIHASIARPARFLRGLSAAAADEEVGRLLELVRLPAGLARRYPVELSGGELQRVGIARALAAEPELIICDEITSALDVSVQAAVLKLLGELRTSMGLSLLFITHDLGVVATVADGVIVLDSGEICEEGPVRGVLSSPRHPYTQRLLQAAPSITSVLEGWSDEEGSVSAVPAAVVDPGGER